MIPLLNSSLAWRAVHLVRYQRCRFRNARDRHVYPGRTQVFVGLLLVHIEARPQRVVVARYHAHDVGKTGGLQCSAQCVPDAASAQPQCVEWCHITSFHRVMTRLAIENPNRRCPPFVSGGSGGTNYGFLRIGRRKNPTASVSTVHSVKHKVAGCQVPDQGAQMVAGGFSWTMILARMFYESRAMKLENGLKNVIFCCEPLSGMGPQNENSHTHPENASE